MPGEAGWVEFNESAVLDPGFYWVKWCPSFSFGNGVGFVKLLAEWEGSYWQIVSTDGSNGDALEGRVLAYHVMVAPEG